jgi:hypothetical protein
MPEVLQAHLDERFDRYPALLLLTGDARFAQRPLARLLAERGKHYRVTIQDNQRLFHDFAILLPPGPTASVALVVIW